MKENGNGKSKRVYAILMILPLFVTIAALFFLPDRIPAHFGANNEVTRWGSKYEALIWPSVTILFGLFLLEMNKAAAKQEKEKNGNEKTNNEKTAYIAGIGGLLVFDALTLYFLYADFKQTSNLSDLKIDIWSTAFGVMGIAFVIIGNIMPKMKRNSIMGLRTTWSMKNDETWKKSQHFGGITFMAAGVLMTAGCLFFFRGMAAFLWVTGLTAIMLTVDIWYTWRVARNIDITGSAGLSGDGNNKIC